MHSGLKIVLCRSAALLIDFLRAGARRIKDACYREALLNVLRNFTLKGEEKRLA
jgi:hypothetical protein